jgi:ABC-type bacteriocin transporter
MNKQKTNTFFTKAKEKLLSLGTGIQQWFDGLFTKKKKDAILIKQHDLTDCGAACLASVCANFGLHIPIARIRQYASTDQKGTNVLGLVEAANQLGLSAKAVKGPIESIYEFPFPAIAHVVIDNKLQHYVVVYKADKKSKRIEFMDPAHGTMNNYSEEEFSNIWTGIMVLLSPMEKFEQGDQTVSVAQRFLFLIKPHKAQLYQVLLGAAVFTLLGLSTSIYLQKILDNVLPDANQNLLNLLSLIMIGILVVQIIINYTRSIITIKTGQQIDARLILGYYKHLLNLPQQFFDSMRVGEVISRMNDAVKIRVFINEVLVTFAVNVFILIFSFFLMFTSYWKLALVMLTVIPFYAAVYYYSNKVNRKTQRKLMEDSADLQAQVVESINSVGTIKRFGLEKFANVKTENRFIKLLGTIYTSATNSVSIGNAGSFISGIFVVVLLWTGATFVLKHSITPGELLSFYALMGYFTGPVISLIGMNRTIQDALIAADRLFEIMDLEREPNENRIKLEKDMMGDIHFKDVNFRYGTRATVFEKLNLHIPKGKVTAIVGESGSGKTTLLSLLQNIYPLQSGNIFIGDYDLQYLNNESLRTLVSVVPQKVDLFSGDVVDNIAVGEFDPDMKRIISICQMTGTLEFIEQLPNGFKTHLGENGASLSGGQRQRLAIARALYKDPEILILDEATSALDSLSEQRIQEAIQELRNSEKTIIIIAHRLSTIMNADKIVVMHKGEVVEEGEHEELLYQKGKYYDMWEQQFPVLKQMMKVPRKRVAKKERQGELLIEEPATKPSTKKTNKDTATKRKVRKDNPS